jgi:hypothetical protein
VNILSVFISSNRSIFLLNCGGLIKTEVFNFYPFFQSKEDLEFLVSSYLKSQGLRVGEVTIIPISTIFNFPIFGKQVNFISVELSKKSEFLYVYLDNLTLYSNKNISLTSIGLSKRSNNFIANRSVFSTNKFNGDIEEIVYLSRSINDTLKTFHKKVVFGGDYFTNPEIPNEFKLNLMTEILESGFYEIYLDKHNEFPNFLNLRNNSAVPLKSPDFQKFSYLITSEKLVEILFESKNTHKFLNLKLNDTFFLHFKSEKDLKLKYKGKDLKKGETLLDTNFSGIFFDLRSSFEKKKHLGVESFRKVLKSIESEHDYSSL